MWQPVFLWESSVRSVKKSERMKYKSAVGQMRKHEKDRWERLEFCMKTDNAGTGKCRRGASNMDVNLRRLSELIKIFFKILSAPYGLFRFSICPTAEISYLSREK